MRSLSNPSRTAALALALVGNSCHPPAQRTPPPATAPAALVALAGAAVMIGSGDIARCDGTGDEGTAMIVDSILRADSVAKVEDVVFTLGDNAYTSGTDAEFQAAVFDIFPTMLRKSVLWPTLEPRRRQRRLGDADGAVLQHLHAAQVR